MKITSITLKNFRGFKNLQLELHPAFNIIIGINGTGKTAILEGLKIASGSLMLGMDKVKDKLYSPGIDKKNDVHQQNFEKQWPVTIIGDGNIFSEQIHWSRELNGEKNNTTTKNAYGIWKFSEQIQEEVKEGRTNLILPLIAFFSINRFKIEKSEDKNIEAYGSRLRGYYNSLDEQTTMKFFRNLFRTETLGALQEGKQSEMLLCVENAVRSCISDCRKVFHHVKSDELVIEFTDERTLPFRLLSEGVRITLAMAMEIAFRCYLLNGKKLGLDSTAQTTGIVLIDEIDLHLHPSWQKKVVQDFSKTFPSIQFVATTHSPLVIGSLLKGKIHALKDAQIFSIPSLYGKDANTILIEMDAEERLPEIKALLNKYYILIENGRGKEPEALQIRTQLGELIGQSDTELQKADIMLSFFE